MTSKRLLSMTSSTSYYLNRRESKSSKNFNYKRRDGCSSRNSKRSSSKSKKLDRDKDRRRRLKENDSDRKIKSKSKEKEDEKKSEIEPINLLNENNNIEISKNFNAEEKHFAHFHLPISPLHQEKNKDKNNKTDIITENTLALDSDNGGSDTGSSSSVEKLKKSVRNSVKLNKVLAISKPKTQLTININCNKSSPINQFPTLKKKIEFNPTLNSKFSNDSSTAEKLLTLPPPPLPPDLIINKDFKPENKDDDEYSDSDCSASTSSSRSSKASNINNTINITHNIIKENETSQTSNEIITSVKEILAPSQSIDDMLNKGLSLPPEFSNKFLSSADLISKYVDKLRNYMNSIRTVFIYYLF